MILLEIVISKETYVIFCAACEEIQSVAYYVYVGMLV